MKGYKPEFGSSETKIKEYMSNLTWDEFMNLCTYVKNNMASISNMLEVPMWYDSDANYIITKMFQNNVPYTSIGANGKGVIDFKEGENFNKVVDILDDARQAFKDGLMTTKGIKNTYGSDYFTNEKCLFSIGSSGGSGYNFPQADAFDLGVCRVPASNNNPLYVSQGPTLTMFNDRGLSDEANNKLQLYAWKFMKYITNGQVNAEICINGSEGYVPVRSSAYETSFFQQFMAEGERYAKCYKVVVDEVNDKGGYLVSKAFKGSASLRDECGSMLTASLNAANKEAIPALVNRAINDASLKM
jgi:ABC-type glycerol-3-phosphate transport system substrate-binding protein